MYTLVKSDNWAAPYIEYVPQDAGIGQEPMVSIGTMVRNTFLSPPLSWGWNRSENSTVSTQPQVQDYTIPVTDFGFLEKVSLTDPNGKVWEIKDVLNNNSLSKTSTSINECARPHAVSVISSIPGVSVRIRFMSTPEQIYLINLTYQRASIPFESFSVTSVLTAAAGQTTYNGTFTPSSFNVGEAATIFGFKTTVNNGSFVIVSVTTTQLILANSSGVAETISASAVNSSWGPIPDYYSDIYNNLYLAEALAFSDDTRSQQYRQRGVAALLAKAEGLTDMQKNIYAEQMLNMGREGQSVVLKLQQGIQGRGV